MRLLKEQSSPLTKRESEAGGYTSRLELCAGKVSCGNWLTEADFPNRIQKGFFAEKDF
jgi:hypothetical protein